MYDLFIFSFDMFCMFFFFRVFLFFFCFLVFFFQAEDGIRDLVRSRGLGDVYKRQAHDRSAHGNPIPTDNFLSEEVDAQGQEEEKDTHDKEGSIVNAPPHHLTHFLGDNARHGVHPVSYTHLTLPTSDLV